MSLTRPWFSAGSLTAQPEHPHTWSVNPIIQYKKNTTLNGTEVRDLSWRKYEYELVWEAMSNTDFDQLEALFNYHLDERSDIQFIYPKWPQTVSGVTVFGELSSRGFTAGSGNQLYYSKVTVKLIEKESRI